MGIDIVNLYRATSFLDYAGTASLIVLRIYIVAQIGKGWHGLIKDTPRWRTNKENFLAEVAGWVIAAILCGTAVLARNWLGANVYGIVALNGAVALIIRFFAPAVWVVSIWWSWSKQADPDPNGPMKQIKNDTVMRPLNRGITAAAITSSALASGVVEPSWLGTWWAILVATSFVCITLTRIDTTQRPIEIWHKITKDKYRE